VPIDRQRIVIRALAEGQPVRRLCDLWAVAPSHYYYPALADDDGIVPAWIAEALLEFPADGIRRVTTDFSADSARSIRSGCNALN
jgi:hypothetical protein